MADRHPRSVAGLLRRLTGCADGAAPDRELLDRFLTRRDESAFELLVRRHERLVFGVCRRVLGHAQDAEDAFQATFLVLARKGGSVGSRESLAGWLYRVAYRIALRARANAAARARHVQSAGEMQGIPSDAASPPEAAHQADLRGLLDRELDRLPAKYRAPVILCHLQGYTNEEAARQLGCPTGTVVTRLARARRMLRNRLTRRGLALPAGVLGAALSPAATAAAPEGIVPAAVRAAVVSAADVGPQAGGLSPAVAALARSGARVVQGARLKVLAAFLAIAGGIATGLGLAYRELAAEPERSPPRAVPGEAGGPPRAEGPGPVGRMEWSRAFRTGRSPRVLVETTHAAIRVVTAADGLVEARMTRRDGRALTAVEAAPGDVSFAATRDGDTIRVKAGKEVPRGEEAAAQLRVPTGATLELVTRDGDVTVTGGTGAVTVDVSNGAVVVRDHRGPLRVVNRNGRVAVSGGSGPLDVEATRSDVDLSAEGAVVAARVSNGTLRFAGTLADGRHSLRAANGHVLLALPADARFRVDATAARGTVANTFPLDEAEVSGQTRLRGRAGRDPGADVVLHAANGRVEIRKRP